MIISICGIEGSGKTTVGKLLAKHLGYKYYSMGYLRGVLATERGITIDELNKIGEKEDWTDRQVDEIQTKIGKNEDNFVIDGRTSFYFIPQSFKVFLKVEWEEAGRRTFDATDRKDEAPVKSSHEKAVQLKARFHSNIKRYKTHYNIDLTDEENYDVIIDTTSVPATRVIDMILTAIKKDPRFKSQIH